MVGEEERWVEARVGNECGQVRTWLLSVVKRERRKKKRRWIIEPL